MNLKGYLSAHDGHMVFAPSKLPYLAKYHLENGTMVKDWNFYFDRSINEACGSRKRIATNYSSVDF